MQKISNKKHPKINLDAKIYLFLFNFKYRLVRIIITIRGIIHGKSTIFKEITCIIFFNTDSKPTNKETFTLNISFKMSIKLTRASINETIVTTIKEFLITNLSREFFPIKLNTTKTIAKGYTNCKNGPVSFTIDSTPRTDNNKDTKAIAIARKL